MECLRQVVGRLEPGRALVLAAGEGRNAVFLAQHGFDVTAVDISARGLTRAFDGWRRRYYENVVVDLDEGMHQAAGAVVRLLVEKVPAPVPAATTAPPAAPDAGPDAGR